MALRFKQVDVFTDRPFLGNPVAVVLDADGLDGETMQRIANWTNLSETTFLLKPTVPEADYRVRIFTPRSELPFAGHPTLGTAHAALDAGVVAARAGKLVQECRVGLVNLAVSGEGAARRISLELPPAKIRVVPDDVVAELEACLGAPVLREPAPRAIDVGPVWLVARLESAARVGALAPDFARIAALEARAGVTGVTVFGAQAGGDSAIEVRSFAPGSGVAEDPVCGSGNGCVAVFLRDTRANDIPPRYVSAQGMRVGRDGRVSVEIAPDGMVRLGGACVTCVEGTLTI